MDKYKTSELSRMLASYLEQHFDEFTEYYNTRVNHHKLASLIEQFYEELP